VFDDGSLVLRFVRAYLGRDANREVALAICTRNVRFGSLLSISSLVSHLVFIKESRP